MRFDELIVALGDDEARIRFHPQMTVVGPMPDDERAQLIDTLLSAARGDRDEVTLTLVDGQGQSMRCTSDGVFDAEGVPAPALLGEPVPSAAELRQAVVVDAADLRLPAGRLEPGDQAELTTARIALEELRRRQAVDPFAGVDPSIATELASLDARLQDADEAEDRRAHFKAKSRLADVQAELDVIEALAHSEQDDERLLATTDELTRLEERRTEANRVAERTRAAVRTAATILKEPIHSGAALLELEEGPDPLTDDFAAAAKAWQRAAARVRTLEIAVSNHTTNDITGDLDRRIHLLAPLDQDELWAAHHRVRDSERRFQAVTADHQDRDDIPADVEAALDAAHIERIRAEEVAAVRWRPGILASGVMAVLGLASAPLSPYFGLAMLVTTAVLVGVLILGPRRTLAQAVEAEDVQLARIGATSYLGLHLRRLADPENDSAQRELTALARERTMAMVAWKELVGHLDPADADGMEAEIRGHALRFNAAMRAEHTASLTDELTTANLVRDEARAALRVSAARVQHRLDQAETDAAEATTIQHGLLLELAIEPGPGMAEAIAQHRVQAMQRHRVRQQARSRYDAAHERDELLSEIARLEQPGWEGAPPLPPSSAAVSLLRRRREELRSRAGVAEELADVPAQIEAMAAKVRDLEFRLGDHAGPEREAVAKRLLARLAKARDRGDDLSEALPVVLDDPLVRIAVDRRCDLLEMLLRVSERMQLVYVTDDPVVVEWARRHASVDALLLLEPVAESA